MYAAFVGSNSSVPCNHQALEASISIKNGLGTLERLINILILSEELQFH
jgi:hypothetical protein